MRQYTVDAFTDRVFAGNPAAVCIMDDWIDEGLMMQIAVENNLSETAFAVGTAPGRYHLRWFTPGGEIDLCGHATLAAGYVALNFFDKDAQEVRFDTLSGELAVKRRQGRYELDFPSYELRPAEVTDAMEEALGVRPLEAWTGRDLLCVLESEELVRSLEPDLEKVKKLDRLMCHVTARGKNFDCVSRTFSPKLSVPEDPVCGSGHCHIAPLWASKLGKKDIVAFQASKRTGVLYCSCRGERISITGDAVLFATSELHIGK